MLIKGQTMQEVAKKRQEYINKEVLSFLCQNGYKEVKTTGEYANKLNKKLAQEGKKLEIFIKNEKLLKGKDGIIRLHLEAHPKIVRAVE